MTRKAKQAAVVAGAGIGAAYTWLSGDFMSTALISMLLFAPALEAFK